MQAASGFQITCFNVEIIYPLRIQDNNMKVNLLPQTSFTQLYWYLIYDTQFVYLIIIF